MLMCWGLHKTVQTTIIFTPKDISWYFSRRCAAVIGITHPTLFLKLTTARGFLFFVLSFMAGALSSSVCKANTYGGLYAGCAGRHDSVRNFVAEYYRVPKGIDKFVRDGRIPSIFCWSTRFTNTLLSSGKDRARDSGRCFAEAESTSRKRKTTNCSSFKKRKKKHNYKFWNRVTVFTKRRSIFLVEVSSLCFVWHRLLDTAMTLPAKLVESRSSY